MSYVFLVALYNSFLLLLGYLLNILFVLCIVFIMTVSDVNKAKRVNTEMFQEEGSESDSLSDETSSSEGEYPVN